MSTDPISGALQMMQLPVPVKLLNRKRVTALTKALNTVLNAHRFTAPRGDHVIGEELNALALAVAGVIRQAPDSALDLRAWFALTLAQIMAAPRPPEGHG